MREALNRGLTEPLNEAGFVTGRCHTTVSQMTQPFLVCRDISVTNAKRTRSVRSRYISLIEWTACSGAKPPNLSLSFSGSVDILILSDLADSLLFQALPRVGFEYEIERFVGADDVRELVEIESSGGGSGVSKSGADSDSGRQDYRVEDMEFSEGLVSRDRRAGCGDERFEVGHELKVGDRMVLGCSEGSGSRVESGDRGGDGSKESGCAERGTECVETSGLVPGNHAGRSRQCGVETRAGVEEAGYGTGGRELVNGIGGRGSRGSHGTEVGGSVQVRGASWSVEEQGCRELRDDWRRSAESARARAPRR